jgi:hypothetical protein
MKMVIIRPQPPSRGNEPRYPLNRRRFGCQSRSTQIRLQYQLCHSGSKYVLREGENCELRCFLCANALQFFLFIYRQSICFKFYPDRPHMCLLKSDLHISTYFIYFGWGSSNFHRIEIRRDRQTKTRFKMATEQYTSPKPTYIFVLWLHQLAWRLALYESKDSCFCSHAYCGWPRHFVIRGQAKKTSRFANMYCVLKSQTPWHSLCVSLWKYPVPANVCV